MRTRRKESQKVIPTWERIEKLLDTMKETDRCTDRKTDKHNLVSSKELEGK